MPDFGEVLADIRDHFAEPLPYRVRPIHVFIAVLLESLGAMLLRPFGYRSPIHPPNFDGDLTAIRDQFNSLHDLPCSRAQIEQAEDLLRDTLMRFQMRIQHEQETWLAAAHAAVFLGTLTIILLLTSSMMCLMTHRLPGDAICLVAIIVIETIAGSICLRHWHYR